jgi:hypothetical protein
VSKEAPYAAFARSAGPIKAERQHISSVCVSGLIFRDQLLRGGGSELACLYERFDTTGQHSSIGQLHPIALDFVDLGVREARAVPSPDRIGLQSVHKAADGFVIQSRRYPAGAGLPSKE